MNKAKVFFAVALTMGWTVVGSAESSALSLPSGTEKTNPSFNQTTEEQADSSAFVRLHESMVSATKAPQNAPFAISEIGQRSLDNFSHDVQELPYLLAKTPGIVAWGENGLGTGTTYMRIRGAAGSRINVTLDGVALNSPEDQCVFWANMNSYSAFLGGLQIQRGVGSSSNGDGAFGGTVALSTKTPSYAPSADFSVSYGSYNSAKANLSFNSGLIGKRTFVDGNISYSRTDGYVHGTGGDGGNWMLGLHVNLSDKLVLRYRNFGNVERTGQAWNGVVTGDNDLSIFDGTYGAETGIRTYADMCKVGLGRFNNLYERLTYDDNGQFAKDANGNYITERYKMNDGSYWKRTTDNFIQDHNILSLAWTINEWWDFNVSAHYTYGYGYYSEFRPDNKLKKFGLQDIWDAKGKTVSDFVRKKGLDQHAYGLLANASYTKDAISLKLGLNAQNFNSNHFGYISYISNPEVESNLDKIIAAERPESLKDDPRKYYDSDAMKTDVSAFAKLSYTFANYFQLFGDLQLRYVRYVTDGINDKFVPAEGGSSKTGPWRNQRLDIHKNYFFANPKAGLNFNKDGHNAFASFAMAGREPERNNFTDNGGNPAPVPEMLFDYEAGYSYSGRNWEVAATLYYMQYKNQFVQTGMVSDIGEPLTTNIARSYRLGAELTASYTPAKWFSIDGNIALSRNRILDFTEYVEDWDDWEGNSFNGGKDVNGVPFDGDGYIAFHYDNSTLAFSPSVIAGVNATFRFLHGARVVWSTNYVSRQYIDNTQNIERSLPAYTFTDINIGYTLEVGKSWMRSVDFGVKLGNIFNSHYAQSAWVYSAITASYGHTNDNRYTQIGFIPTASFTALGTIALHF